MDETLLHTLHNKVDFKFVHTQDQYKWQSQFNLNGKVYAYNKTFYYSRPGIDSKNLKF